MSIGRDWMKARTQVKVLVVDDEAVMRRHIIRMLRNIPVLDVEIAEARDGSAALLHLRGGLENKPDLIITDLRMEPMGGLDFIRAVRSGDDGIDRFLPMVAMTSDTETDTVTRVLRAGADGLVTKPVSQEMLRRQVLPVLTRESPFIEIVLPEGKYFGPFSPFVKQHVLVPGCPHRIVHKRQGRIAA
ncbi:response regulator [Magnetospirillum sp. ME-1]|uniref:response regulator n=1 Tax=Magnetospirillum sp. ME-1 TaxID=1639348 RepID=UPI000A191041|nr:response regulator [Magnetospirillum sp. ME-1]